MKVFLWCYETSPAGKPVCEVYATVEDGRCLKHITVPARIYARRELMLATREDVDGMELVDLLDLTEAELDMHDGLNKAFDAAAAKDDEE